MMDIESEHEITGCAAASLSAFQNPLDAAIIAFTSRVGIGCSFADLIHRRASLRCLLRCVACSWRSLGHTGAVGHIDAMMPMSHWAMRTSSGFPIDQEQGC